MGRRTGLIVAIIVAIIAVAVAAAVLFFMKGQSDAQGEYAQTHETRTLTFSVEAPAYNLSNDGPVPLHVSGVDVDGNAVEQDFYITPQEASIQLPQGAYTIRVTASPLLSGGRLYALPTQDMEVVVGEADLSADRAVLNGDATAAPGEVASGSASASIPVEYSSALAIVFTDLADSQFTEEAIQASYDAAIAGGMPKVTADQYAQADRSVMTEASYRVDVGNFTFTIPQYWRDRVEVVVDGSTTYVFATGFKAEPLIELRLVDATSDFGTGSSAEWMMFYQDDGAGSRLELWVYGYPFLAWATQVDPSIAALFSDTAALANLVDLSTGGSITYERALMLDQSSVEMTSTQAVESFEKANVIPNIQLL